MALFRGPKEPQIGPKMFLLFSEKGAGTVSGRVNSGCEKRVRTPKKAPKRDPLEPFQGIITSGAFFARVQSKSRESPRHLVFCQYLPRAAVGRARAAAISISQHCASSLLWRALAASCPKRSRTTVNRVACIKYRLKYGYETLRQVILKSTYF